MLFAKEPSQKETVNDLHGTLINLARVVQDDDRAPKLYEKLQRVLFSESVLEDAKHWLEGRTASCDPLQWAYWYFIACWMGRFSRCKELLRQPPEQATDRADLRARLARASGGVVFTTIQKFFPEERGDKHPILCERRNIVVIADEAHRSQYDFIDGFARHMRDALPHASFIGFTGTPIEKTDANTQAVFGDW